MQRVEPYLNTEQGYEKLLIQNQNVGDILQSYQAEEIPRYFKMDGRVFNAEEYPELASVLNTIGYQDSGVSVHRYPFYQNDIWWASISTTEKYLITKPTNGSTYEIYAYKIFFTEEGLISNIIEIDTSFLLEYSPSYIYVADENFFFVYNYTLYKINLGSSSVERINSLTKPIIEGYGSSGFYSSSILTYGKNVIVNLYIVHNDNDSSLRNYILMIYYPEPKVVILKFQENPTANFYRLAQMSEIWIDDSEIVVTGTPLTKNTSGGYVNNGNYKGIIRMPFNITEKTVMAQDFKNINDNGLVDYSYTVENPQSFWIDITFMKMEGRDIIINSLSKIMFFENGTAKIKNITFLDDPSIAQYYSSSHKILFIRNKIVAFIATQRAANVPFYLLAEKQDFILNDTSITFSNFKPIMIGLYTLRDLEVFSNYVLPFAIKSQSYGICFLLDNKYQIVPIQQNSYIKT